jgi:hypothetical protein
MSPKWVVETPGQSWSQKYISGIKSEGSHSLRIELRRNELDVITKMHRNELSMYNFPEGPREEHAYGFDFYLPGAADGADEWTASGVWEDEIIAQWHNRPDTGRGEDWTVPPLSLHIHSDYGLALAVCSDPNPVTTDKAIFAAGYPHWHTLIKNWAPLKGHWVELIFHIRWGWLSAHNPLIEVWKKVDGVDTEPILIKTITEPNMMNDQVGVDFNIGIYKNQWSGKNYGDSGVAKRIIYYDRVRMG